MSETPPTTPSRATALTPATAPIGAVPDRPGAGPPGRPSLSWTELVIAVVAFLALSIGVGVVVITTTGGMTLGAVLDIALSGLVTLATVALTLSVRVRSLAAVGLRGTTAKWLLFGLLGGVVAFLLNRLVIIAYITLSGDTSNPQAAFGAAAGSGGWTLVGILLVGAVFVPVAEELLFRGIGYGALRRHGAVLATIVSAVLFGLAHGINVVLPAAILLGVINAVLYERSRSIWPAVVSHATNNAIVFTLAAVLS